MLSTWLSIFNKLVWGIQTLTWKMNCKNLAALALIIIFTILKAKCANSGNSRATYAFSIDGDYYENLYKNVNEIELIYDDKNSGGTIEVSQYYYEAICGEDGYIHRNLDLNETLIKAAVWGQRLDRLQTIFDQMRHINLSNNIKAEIFELAVENLHKSKSAENYYVGYDILNFLLLRQYQLYYTSECYKLYPMIEDPISAKLVLCHDSDYFKKFTNCNFVQEAIRKGNFTRAAQILEYGLDPAKVIDGKNALDYVLADTKCVIVLNNSESSESEKQICLEYEIERKKLIEILMNVPKFTFTFENFKSACLYNYPDIATKILQSKVLDHDNNYNPGEMNESPLEVVLQINDCNVIRETLKAFLEKLSLDQLDSVQQSCEHHPCLGGNNAELKKAIDEVLKKVKTRIFYLEMFDYIRFFF